MKIIVSFQFEKDFEKEFSNYQIKIPDLISALSKVNYINIWIPYYKAR